MIISPFERVAELVAAGRPFAIATVVRTLGSTPQTIGAKLIVTDNEAERPFGTLGGGCVEADAILAARQVLSDGAPSLREYRLTEDLAWNTGLVCGGTMWILAEPGDRAVSIDARSVVDDLERATRGGPPLAFVTSLRREDRGFAFAGRVVVLADGRLRGTLGDAAFDERARTAAVDQMRHGTSRLVSVDETHDLLIEPVTSRAQLVVAGGGHVAKAIARQARLLDFDVTILEDRPEFASADRFDGAAVVQGEVPASVAAFDYGWQTFLVIATRGHKLDGDCVLAAVRTGVKYIGLLGSRRKTILIAEMLREAGVLEERIAAIHAPVGLDLGGRTPAEIALAVLAEITLARYGGTGQPMRDASEARRSSLRPTSGSDT